MKSKPSRIARCWPVLLCLSLAFGPAAVSAKDFKFEALLIWATNAAKSPNPNHKPVDVEVRKKLKDLPLRWTNFFEVNRVVFAVAPGGSQEEMLSEKCRIIVKNVGEHLFEVSLIGKGEPVLKRIQRLPKGEMLVLGGNAPNETGWLVALKRKE